jgi:hypothetical protein
LEKDIRNKLSWLGKIVSVQPRIRLLRSFNQRSHSYLGYSLNLFGNINGEEREFSIGIGKTAQEKYQFKVGDEISGESVPVSDPKKEPVEFYKTSKLNIVNSCQPSSSFPPWNDIAVNLKEYRDRGHRRLSVRTYDTHCKSCKWGCNMPVEMIIDQWNPSIKRYRFETFCYGPKSCQYYKAGPIRIVPGRKGMSWEEPDWVDEENTEHRSEDE